VTIPLLLGGLMGLGLFLVAKGATATAPSLRVEVERSHVPAVEPSGRLEGIAGRLTESWLRPRRSLDADLAIQGTTVEQQLLVKLVGALSGASAPVLCSVLAGVSGAWLPVGPVLGVSVALGLVGFLLPDAMVHSRATERRQEFRAALSAFVNVVTIVLAGGGGIETALDTAATSSTAWPFQRIRTVLAQSRMSGEAPWDALDRLGRVLQVPELSEVAASITLAAARAEAESQSEMMALPTVAMLLAFILLIGYPALANVLTL
jgi:Flp pilus assembly protein TadB